MSLIDNIRQPILVEMQVFKKIFAKALESDNPLLSSINEYVLQSSGKQLRPILTILSGKLCGEVTEATYNGALSLELLHNASLIHDDVIDDTMERRGRRSVNARWANKVAVLSGDYMLSNSLISATKTRNIDILNAISKIGMELSEGELMQLINTKKTKITEEDYFKVIRKKTALLFATCTEVGALSVNANVLFQNHLRNFGEYLGICFQIKDDIFDYYRDIEIGKPTGNDLQDGKVTLPLIYALRNSENSEKEEVMSIIDSNDFSKENIDFIMQFSRDKGGVDYAARCMDEYKNKAIEELNDFPDSDVKRALVLCVEFATERKS
ncbi:MAG: polyprenyl synthetase family protein [Paludibacter sp.]